MSEWKMVPVEPTADMAEAGCQGYMEADGAAWIMHPSSMDHAYSAMLAAAPAPAFDEAAERAAFEADYVFRQKRDEYGVRYADPVIEQRWQGWLACAKRKAGVQ